MKSKGSLSGKSENVDLQVAFNIATNGLTKEETSTVRSALLRSIARALESCPYSDFGIDNISIK